MAEGSRAVKSEARSTDPDKPVLVRETTVEFNGEEYALRQDALDDVEILEFLEDEQYIKALRRILGLDRWSQFKESVRTADGRVPATELERFLEVVMKALDPTNGS